jgi:hypothetical protein
MRAQGDVCALHPGEAGAVIGDLNLAGTAGRAVTSSYFWGVSQITLRTCAPEQSVDRAICMPHHREIPSAAQMVQRGSA